MATIVLGAVGTAIGGGFGGAVLGFSGAAIGSMVDSWIVSSMMLGQRIEGQRLDSLRLTSATEGVIIPRLYGRMRIGGNIICATDFREEVNTRKQGSGKGCWTEGHLDGVQLLCLIRRGFMRGRDHRHRPHLGRWRGPRSEGCDMALLSG